MIVMAAVALRTGGCLRRSRTKGQAGMVGGNHVTGRNEQPEQKHKRQ